MTLQAHARCAEEKQSGQDGDGGIKASAFENGSVHVGTKWISYANGQAGDGADRRMEEMGYPTWHSELPPRTNEYNSGKSGRLIGQKMESHAAVATDEHRGLKKTYGKMAAGILDENDPRNARVQLGLKGMTPDGGRPELEANFQEKFQLANAAQLGFAACDPRRYRLSKRSILISTRDQKPMLFEGTIPIPMTDAMIHGNPAYEKIVKEAETAGMGIPEEDMDEHDDHETIYLDDMIRKHEIKVQSFLSKVKAAQKMMDSGSRKVGGAFSADAFITETVKPEFSISFEAISKLFAPIRKLKPRVKSRRTISKPAKTELLFQVIRAKHLPERVATSAAAAAVPDSPSRRRRNRSPSPSRRRNNIDDDEEDDGVGGAAAGDGSRRRNVGMGNNDNLHLFVELEFQGKQYRTPIAEGPAPLWNKELRLEFLPNGPSGNTFDPANLLAIRDEVSISLYDEIIVTDNVGEPRTEKRLVGHGRLPFTTVYSQDVSSAIYHCNSLPSTLVTSHRNTTKISMINL